MDKSSLRSMQATSQRATTPRRCAAVLNAAAVASLQGAASTKDLVARFGRARNLGERSRGTLDPGATSISLIFKGFLEGYQNQ